MSDKLPQPTDVLWHRLKRMAKAMDRLAADTQPGALQASYRAYANTCLQACGRLQVYFHQYGEVPPTDGIDNSIGRGQETVIDV